MHTEPLHSETSPPSSPGALFWACTLIALQGFGGVMAVVQREMVDRKRWMSPTEFAQDWALAQILPGPNVVNLSIMFGERYFGLRGALAAAAGMLVAPTVLVLIAGSLYLQWSDQAIVAGALRGMGAVAAGLVIGTGLKLSLSLRTHPLPLWQCWLLTVAAFSLVVLAQWPLWWVLPVIGGIGCLLTWKRLTP